MASENKKLLTLCIVHQPDKILLGMKKRGFGAGRWNSFGGKVMPGETIAQATRREVKEEAGIGVNNLEAVGVLQFEFLGNPEVLEVHIFQSNSFSGKPIETEEMKPRWFMKDAIPFELMWPADKDWYPLFLDGRKFTGKFFYDQTDVILKKEMRVVKGIS